MSPRIHSSGLFSTRWGAGSAVRLVLYTDSLIIGGAEKSASYLLGALPPEVDVTVLGVDRRVVDLVAEERPSAAKMLVPLVRAPWDVRSFAAHVRAIRRLRPEVLQTNCASPWACEYAVVAGLLAPGVRIV